MDRGEVVGVEESYMVEDEEVKSTNTDMRDTLTAGRFDDFAHKIRLLLAHAEFADANTAYSPTQLTQQVAAEAAALASASASASAPAGRGVPVPVPVVSRSLCEGLALRVHATLNREVLLWAREYDLVHVGADRVPLSDSAAVYGALFELRPPVLFSFSAAAALSALALNPTGAQAAVSATAAAAAASDSKSAGASAAAASFRSLLLGAASSSPSCTLDVFGTTVKTRTVASATADAAAASKSGSAAASSVTDPSDRERGVLVSRLLVHPRCLGRLGDLVSAIRQQIVCNELLASCFVKQNPFALHAPPSASAAAPASLSESQQRSASGLETKRSSLASGSASTPATPDRSQARHVTFSQDKKGPVGSAASASASACELLCVCDPPSAIRLSTAHPHSGRPMAFVVSVGAGGPAVRIEVAQGSGDRAPCSDAYATRVLRTAHSLPVMVHYCMTRPATRKA
jgi:hypothetical protein